MTVCPIWNTDADLVDGSLGATATINSPRAGGKYRITGSAAASIPKLSTAARARLTSWVEARRREGEPLPKVTTSIVDDAELMRAMSITDRLHSLLYLLARLSVHLGAEVQYAQGDSTYQRLMASCECAEDEELSYLRDILAERGWISKSMFMGGGRLKVLVDGYAHLEDLAESAVTSVQGFVAMWFDPTMIDIYENGIAAAINDAGYVPMRIDQKAHNNKIDDEIVAEIRRSRFLVADFTHGEKGPRGGVYYEAGFAHGLSIPVIFTIRADMIDQAHFDTRQYSHILWHDASDLRRQLADKISATLGDGPGRAKVQ